MKITDDVYRLESTKGAYSYVIFGAEIILIDTGLPGRWKSIKKELTSIGVKLKQVKHILLTHHDIDHIGNAAILQELTGSDVWASEEDIPVIYGDVERYGFKKYLKYIFHIKKPKDIKSFTTGQVVNGIEVILTPGHTPGHLCFIYNDVLFIGDLLENKNGNLRPYPKAWNWNNSIMMQSINKICQIPFKWACPAHGEPIERGNLLNKLNI
ncbi:MBL fold metallo-hydrolase [Clostridium pasteurianum]|uniref:Zn-dependent hydrolase, glyoxylase n=1 Tax=Clostridium pasteurianum BC1 TaxID=86416 RepID=R4JXP5_CLOPA|nr:MBL fold metallo-hydrolase [Clostridium pasteurianum]AGK95577.1 Zn-dependent hydrolase, glyoxylase [Clostridium pasteurianum BC1]